MAHETTTLDGCAPAVKAHETPASKAELRVAAPLLDSVIAALMAAVALALWLGAASFERGTNLIDGPATFPRAISLLLGTTSLLLLARSLPRYLRGGSAAVVMRRPSAVFTAMGLVVVYPLLIEHLGYYPATAVWLPVLLWTAGYRKPLGVVLATLGFLVFSRVVFQQLLGTPMP